MKNANKNSQAGVGLIEVLIAVLVLAVGLLGIAALQAVTLKNSSGSAERTQAVVQSYSMMDMLRLQKTAAADGSLNTMNSPTDGTAPTGAYQCSSASSLGTPGSVAGWLADLKMTVAPDACGKVTCSTTGGNTSCEVAVRWTERGTEARSGTTDVVREFKTTSRL